MIIWLECHALVLIIALSVLILNDAYSHMHHFYLRSTSKKKSVEQERAWELSYFLLLCEFKDFRHHEEVKQVAKIWRKLIFLPEELVPDSSLRKTCPVPVQV